MTCQNKLNNYQLFVSSNRLGLSLSSSGNNIFKLGFKQTVLALMSGYQFFNLGLACSPRDQRFASSDPAEVDEF